jgi:hypothetical protein
MSNGTVVHRDRMLERRNVGIAGDDENRRCSAGTKAEFPSSAGRYGL